MKLEQHIGQSHFYPSMQFNLKTISYGNNTLAAAYPTKSDIDAAVDLMTRTGASNIIGVGSGAAIDLAKACHYKYLQDDDGRNPNGAQLILNPSTLGAALTATSRDCLYLCPEEEALIPIYSNTADLNLDGTTVVVDDNAISIPNWVLSNNNNAMDLRDQKGNNATIADSALASLVIALDAAHSLGAHDELDDPTRDAFRQSLDECITSAVLCLNNIESSLSSNADSTQLEALIDANKQLALSSVLNAGKLLSFGQNSSLTRRNVSLALTSSLLPEYFPHGNWNTFTASLLPGLCHAIEENPDIANAEENDFLLDMIAKITGQDKANVTFSHLTEWVENMSKYGQGFIIPTLSSLADGAPDANELMSKVEDNGAFLQSQDADVEYLESLLVSSLNR